MIAILPVSSMQPSAADALSPKSKRRSGVGGVTYLLATAFLSGIVCYRFGTFYGCASSWMSDVRATHSPYGDATIGAANRDDPDSPVYYAGGGSRSSSTIQKIISDPNNDRRFVPRPSSPYDCGVVFFYHIPCTGGASINQWFRKYQKPEFGNISYYQFWALETKSDGSFHPEPETAESTFANGMSEHISNLGPKEWRIAHSHLVSTYLNESEDLLYKWRSDVEAQGCELINTIMLRDPLNHAMSLHKIVKAKNSSRAEWTKYLSSPTGPGKWATVLDFFLYNNHGLRYHNDYPNGPGGRNPFNVTKEVKVARAMELLHRHFDVVTVADHTKFMDTILDWTGWTRIKMPRTNVNRKELEFTKKEVENLQKLLGKNGDIDFVDRVKTEYHGHLSYLAK